MAKIIDSLAFGESSYILSIPYATCSTDGASIGKVASTTNWVETANLEVGARVTVKFTYANGVAAPTLNVNSTGAKTIRYNGSTLPSTQYWAAGDVIEFVYDGTYWNIVGTVKDNDTKYTLRVGASGTTTSAATSNGSTYLKLVTGSTVQNSFKITGAGGTTVASDASGNITVTSTASDTVKSSPVTSGTYYIVADSSSSEQTTTLKKRSNVKFDASGNIIANNIPSTGLIWQTF